MRFRLIAFFLLLLLASPQARPQQLEDSFANPSFSARPRVWWHWMNGNITKEGIRKDLEWMHRAGIVGFHNFDANMSTPQVVEKRLPYMSAEWKEAFNYALDLADSLGMEVSIASSPGWSITGGPWVSEEDAEKKIVWSEISVRGGGKIEEVLPEPPSCCGPYQGIPLYPDHPERYVHYEDLHVLAVRLPDSFAEVPEPEVSVNDPGQDGYFSIEFTYPQAVCLQSLYLIEFTLTPVCLEVMREAGAPYEMLIDDIPLSRIKRTSVRTFDFPPTTGVRFRLRATVPGKPLVFSEASLSPEPRVNLVEDKAGFLPVYTVYDNYPTPETGEVSGLGNVLDVSSYVQDGVLRWTAPAGRWRIFRLGWSLLGNRNGPASPEATGLEVDKFDAGCVRRYYDNYLGMYQEAAGGRLGTSIKGLMIDSYESGKCTWTLNMEKEFKARRGYDLKPWLPVLTGFILESSAKSEQFLFDWRTTLGELITENHYDIVNSILDKYGMFRYCESHEWRKAFVGDGMMPKRYAQVPMATMWIHYTDEGLHSTYPAGEADIRESSSIAHIYGQNICAAESFTVDGRIGERNGMGAYQSMPCNLKALADGMMAEGVNRFVIHTSVHQPVDDKVPGLSLGPFGQWFNRHDTWAEEARSWTDYLSRSCQLLQEGRWVADVAYFYGEDKNVTGIFVDRRISVPDGLNYDIINADILLNKLRLRHRTLTSPAGAEYRVLMIDRDVRYMSYAVLRRILRLARRGIIICGPRPLGKAGLAGSDRRFARMAAKLWDRQRPNVIPAQDCPLPKDVDLGPDRGPDMRFVHRRLRDGELYWIANIDPIARNVTASFRVSGYEPEIWHADTGLVEQASYRTEGGRTFVDLSFNPDDALFVLFRHPVTEPCRSIAKPAYQDVLTLEGPWAVRFQSGHGAPAKTVFPVLKSYTDSQSEGIRFFSGTAEYDISFNLDDAAGEYVLDLGEVHSMARVELNGNDLGLCWKAPYRINAGDALRQGENRLRIKVINSWANRLIGDQKRPEDKRITYTSEQFYLESDEPIPAGLLGPVIVRKTCNSQGLQLNL